MADNNSLATSVLSSAVISALISGAFGLYGNQRLEKYKLELQNRNSVLTKKVAVYSSFNEKLRALSASLNRYVQLCELASKNPGDKTVRAASGPAMNDMTDRMGEVKEAVFNGIDEDVQKKVDKILDPLSMNVYESQKNPSNNPKIIKHYREQFKQELKTLEEEIDTKIGSFQL
jgi:hypothetical protein